MARRTGGVIPPGGLEATMPGCHRSLMDTTNENPKQPYERPRLDVEGTITELTLATDHVNNLDGGDFTTHLHHS